MIKRCLKKSYLLGLMLNAVKVGEALSQFTNPSLKSLFLSEYKINHRFQGWAMGDNDKGIAQHITNPFRYSLNQLEVERQSAILASGGILFD